jgi:hypothetical protein
MGSHLAFKQILPPEESIIQRERERDRERERERGEGFL